MPNDTIQARMETLNDLLIELYPVDSNGKKRDGRSWPAISLHYPVWSHDESMRPTDGTSGAWAVTAVTDVDSDIWEVGLVRLCSRGESPEDAMDRLLEQMRLHRTEPVIAAIKAAEKARLPTAAPSDRS